MKGLFKNINDMIKIKKEMKKLKEKYEIRKGINFTK
jgi:hypothetical protein